MPTRKFGNLSMTRRAVSKLVRETCSDLFAGKHSKQHGFALMTNWLRLSNIIQQASDNGSIRGMYEGIKQATGKPAKKTPPLKLKRGKLIIDRDKQMGRWVEH